MYLGDFAEDDTLHFQFTTHNGSGAAVAPSTAFEAADLAIYKDNGAAQKATTNGVTMTSPFDTVTGLHAVSIDTSNDTGDAGFWTAGSEYIVVLNPDETVDSQSVVKVIAQFSIERAGASLATLKNATYGLSAIETLVDELESRLTAARAGYLDNLNGHTAQSGDVYPLVDTEITTLLNDLAAVLVDTGTTLDGKINTIDTVVDGIQTDLSNGTDGLGALKAAIDALNNISVNDILTTQMTESYNADGTAPTLAQALFLLISCLTEFSISGTTITCKQLDGTTTSATFTLDSSTAPTSRTRAT